MNIDSTENGSRLTPLSFLRSSKLVPVWHLAILSLIAGSVYFTNLGAAKLWDRDEPRNAGCAAEMMQRGDWVVPMFNDELRPQKPVLLYWLMMSAYAVLGQTEFAARIWSAILGVGSVLLTYETARRLFSPGVGLVAGIALATSLMFTVAARAATPDSLLIFCSTAAIWCYVIGVFGKEKNENGFLVLKRAGTWFPTDYRYVLGMYSAMGFGVLAKGPVGIVVPTAIIGMFMLLQRLPELDPKYWDGQGRMARTVWSLARPFAPLHFLKTCWAMRPLTAVGLMLLIAAPWYVWVGVRTGGDFLERFFLYENFGRATTVLENHSGGLWFYPLTILIGFFPWAVFAGPVVINTDRELSKTSPNRTAFVFLLCWIGVQIGLFSLASTKLPSYVTPCYPAVAMLTAACVYQWWCGKSKVSQFWLVAASNGMLVSGLIATGGLYFVSREFLSGSWSIVAIGLIPLLGGGVAAWMAHRAKPRAAIAILGSVSVLFTCVFFGFGTVSVDQTRLTNVVLDPIRNSPDGQAVASFKCLESSWVVYGAKPIYELTEGPATASPNLDREQSWDVKPRISPEDFVELNPNAMFITTTEHLSELQSRLSEEFVVLESTPFFLKNDRNLVLVGRNDGKRMANSENAGQSLKR